MRRSAIISRLAAFASLSLLLGLGLGSCTAAVSYSSSAGSKPSGLVSSLAGQAVTPGSSDGTGTAALLDLPRALTTDGSSLYIADTMNDCIRKMDLATGAVTTLAGKSGTEGYLDGTGTAALFDQPYAIAYSSTDKALYVADMLNYAIRKVDPSSGAVTTVAGDAGHGGFLNGTGTAARFWTVSGLAYDSNANCLYVADSGNQLIRVISLASYSVGTLAGSHGVKGYQDGIGTAALFDYPCGVAVSADGSMVYVADSENSCIRAVTVGTKTVTTVAGTAQSEGHADGVGAAARFDWPRSLVCSGSSLIVADTDNYTLRKIDLSSDTVTTFAGRVGCDGSADGLGSAALMGSFVFNLALGTDIRSLQSCVFIADTGNDLVRMVFL